VLTGLEGIGRRAYLERVVNDNLALHLGPLFLMDETHDLTDIYLWALDETTEFGTRVELAEETRLFSTLHTDEQIREIITRLKIMCEDRCLPCFVDQGGLLEDSGKYRPELSTLIDTFLADHDDGYLAFIHRRKPLTRDLKYSDLVLQQRIPPLESHETTLLFAQLLRKRRKDVAKDSISGLSEDLGGYPPAIYFAATYVFEYGLDALRHDSSTLVDFKAKRFLRFISELRLRDLDWIIAQCVAAEQLLPLEGIAIALDKTKDEIVLSLRNLIDHNLVIVIDDKYRIADPIRDTVHRARGLLSAKQYSVICRNLTRELWPDKGAAPSVEVVDATLHAVAMSGRTDFNRYNDLVRPSTVHRLANESYRRREWKSALEYAIRVETMAPERSRVKHIRFKALVQLEQWEEASDVLRDLQEAKDRLAFYLEGFMLKRRRKYAEACKSFQSALDSGDNSFPVHRDYADCLNRLGRNEAALERIKWVLDRDDENIFILDLMCRICIDGNRLDEAGEVLDKLLRCDVEQTFIHHRRASWQAAKKEFEKALVSASKACETGHATFEARALHCRILIELDQFRDAERELQSIQDRFGRTVRRDVQAGLRIKLLIRQHEWREALAVWDQLEDKGSPMHRALKAGILDEKSNDGSLPLSERNSTSNEAKQIRTDIQVEDEYRIWAEDALGCSYNMMLCEL